MFRLEPDENTRVVFIHEAPQEAPKRLYTMQGNVSIQRVIDPYKTLSTLIIVEKKANEPIRAYTSQIPRKYMNFIEGITNFFFSFGQQICNIPLNIYNQE